MPTFVNLKNCSDSDISFLAHYYYKAVLKSKSPCEDIYKQEAIGIVEYKVIQPLYLRRHFNRMFEEKEVVQNYPQSLKK